LDFFFGSELVPLGVVALAAEAQHPVAVFLGVAVK
jgi:hypothetical protein